MKKNTLALNIGEEALIEGFGIVRCIKTNFSTTKFSCFQCCMYGKLCECRVRELVNSESIGCCLNSYRKAKGLDDCKEGVIFTRITAVVKLNNK